jgi:hypothetical protein
MSNSKSDLVTKLKPSPFFKYVESILGEPTMVSGWAKYTFKNDGLPESYNGNCHDLNKVISALSGEELLTEGES